MDLMKATPAKVSLGAKNCLYPSLTVLVGAMVAGKPNLVTIAHVGIMDLSSISLGINKAHYTNLFNMGDKGCWKLGEHLARAWSIGKELKQP
jgi:hypothetical protein